MTVNKYFSEHDKKMYLIGYAGMASRIKDYGKSLGFQHYMNEAKMEINVPYFSQFEAGKIDAVLDAIG